MNTTNENNTSGVRGVSDPGGPNTSLGRECHGVQVAPDRQPDTVLGRDHHAVQVAPDRYLATVPNNQKLRMATWNVRTLHQRGKIDNVLAEMERMEIGILGMSETRWTEAGDIKKNKYRIIYSGGEKHQRGVGIILNKQVSKSLLGFWAISDRILLVKVRGNPFNISIIQVYAPTSASTDEEIELFYNQLDKAKEQCKPNEVQVIMGDFNAKVESLQEKPWLTVKAALQQAADETIPEIENIRTSKAWITKDILDMMEQRRMLKLKDPVHYRELDGNIKKRCNEAKENWLTIKCNEIENLKNKNDLDMYKRISEISGKRHTITSGCIRDENGKILTETADICKRWERYIDHLFEDEREELMENAECTWTITPGLKGNIEAAEMWFLRRMFKISYRDRVSNIRVLERAKTTRELLNCIQKRQLTFLGHSIRRGKLECLALEGRLEGKRSRGRQRTKFLDIMANSFEASGVTITVPEMLHCAYDRDAWKGMVGQVCQQTRHR
ncbi:Craniofacial development protein 2 [Nymphon striatum]|nr:Craniofacial development protein 2 [Nymphon striatum]